MSLLFAACTSNQSSDVAIDSTATSPAMRVSGSPPPVDPASPTDIERDASRSVAQKVQDAGVEARVKRALTRTKSLRVFPFRPTVVNGHLILRGDVNTPDQYHRAERVAGQVEGVTAVTNRLTMGGRPVTEQRLASKEEALEREAVYHTVRPGDTMWDIAREYRASVEQIRNLNDLSSSNLRPGQRIRVR